MVVVLVTSNIENYIFWVDIFFYIFISILFYFLFFSSSFLLWNKAQKIKDQNSNEYIRIKRPTNNDLKKTYSHKWNYGHFHPLIYIICFFCTSIISFIFVTFLNLCYFHYYFLFDPSTHPTPYHILALYYMLQYQCNSENRLFIHLLLFFLA